MNKTHMRKEVVVAVLLVLLSSSAYAIFTGTIEGYVYFLNGSLVNSGAAVNATVASCSGSGCTGNTTTDTNSYYVIANLNLPANGTITAAASKSSHSGSNTTTANTFMAAYANITICQPPSAPNLTAAVDNHDTNRTLTWTSGVDPNGYPTYGIFQFSSNASVTGATSPQAVSSLTIGNNYTWRVATCNNVSGNGCCSANSTDTFTVSNTAPSAPSLTLEDDTDSTSITFAWTSGVDSDGDATYDEFSLSNTTDFSVNISSSGNATSPVTVSALSTPMAFYWRVRTCDVFGACSAYSLDSFLVRTCPAGSGGGGGGGGSGGASSCQGNTFDECILGDKGCRANARLVCGNFDTDQYLELGAIDCKVGETCDNGACVADCDEQWECTEWSGCTAAGVETRSCEEINGCGTDAVKPYESRSCIPGLGETPLLIGVPPFTIAPPDVLTTPIVPIATALLALLLAALTLSLVFDKQLDTLVLYGQLERGGSLLKHKQFAKADVYNRQVLDPHIRKAPLDERKPFHRKILRKYHELNRDIARYHEQLARQVGDKAKTEEFAKRVDEYAKQAMKYAK